MQFTFKQDYDDFKAGERVPSSMNTTRLLRAGIIQRRSHVDEAVTAQVVEAVESLIQETPKPQTKGKKK